MEQLSQAAHVASYVWTHPANRKHRVRALARAVTFQMRGRLGRRTLTAIGSNAHMWALLHHSAASNAVYANPPDWNEMQAWACILRPGDLFVDVGANVGTYALWAADHGAVVIAVEPDPRAAALLRENVALNNLPITVIEAALGSKVGSLMLTEGNDTTNHMLPDGSTGGQRVRAQTLDALLRGRAARGVKIDVEGAERIVLEGALECLAAGRIDVLQLEWNSTSAALLGEDRAPVAAILAAHGYSLHRPDRHGILRPVDGIPFGPDVFAVGPVTSPDRRS